MIQSPKTTVSAQKEGVEYPPHDWFRRSMAGLLLSLVLWFPESSADSSDPSFEPIDARAYFRLAGIDDSQFARLTDDAPWGSGEDELLWRILYRGDDFSAENFDQWRERTFQPSEVRADSEAARGRFFGLSGRVTWIEEIKPPEEVVQKFELNRYYQCRLKLEGSDLSAVLFAKRVPSGLSTGEPLDARTQAVGCFLKWSRGDDGRAEPVFAATRLEWFPDTVLGRLGVDAGLLDSLVDRKTVLASERECFYQILSAVGRAKPGSLLREAGAELKATGRSAFSAVPLFEDPKANRGKLFAFTGLVRRVVRVVVEDPDIVRRFGIREYYEMSLFTEDSQGNPLTFCVRAIPEGMPTGQGPDYAETVTVAGFFLKTWAFHSEYASRVASKGDQKTLPKQLAPLLIGREPVWHARRAEDRSSYWGLAAGGAFIVLLLFVWLILRRLAKEDALRNRQYLARMAETNGRTASKPNEMKSGIDPE